MPRQRPSWNEYFMLIAKVVSTRSTCNSRPIGAVLVRDNEIITTGYAGAMPKAMHCIDQPDLEDGSPFCFRRVHGVSDIDKYNFCKSTHAEANAIAQAARKGRSIEGATLYVTLAPCYVCLKLLANSRIKAIYYEHPYESQSPERDAFWAEEMRNARIDVFEQLIISPETYDYCLADIRNPISRRRMKSTF
jgi:dCMP deaminase